MIFRHKFVHLRLEFHDGALALRFIKIHKRNDMKIAFACVTSNRVDEMIVCKKLVKLRKKFRIVVGVDDDVVYKWRRVQALEIFAQKRETFAPYSPIFCRLRFALCDFCTHGESIQCPFSSFSLKQGVVRGLIGKFRHENEFWHATEKNHNNFGNERETELEHLRDAEMPDNLRYKTHREPECLVVVGFK